MSSASHATVKTDGGSVVEGSVEAGRDFVGRDQIQINVIVLAAPTMDKSRSGVERSALHLLNFARPITTSQRAEIEELIGQPIGVMIEVAMEFDDNRAYGPQCVTLLDSLKLSAEQWQTLPLVVNLPGITPGAACLLAELHGRMGYFPTIVRLRRRPESAAGEYTVAELIKLQERRDAARKRRK